MTASSTHQWFKSSYSGGSGTECVEAALTPTTVLVRDSKRTGGPLLSVGSLAWSQFVAWGGTQPAGAAPRGAFPRARSAG
ncbi:DUF397 domain-containing protein [Streptomyces sp. NPDC093094]|uniref:DUF397 domain-containing protein n=1 Tax=Streptomyces sp. NPDC093094 TaxID=3366026 RepID=UPI0038149369